MKKILIFLLFILIFTNLNATEVKEQKSNPTNNNDKKESNEYNPTDVGGSFKLTDQNGKEFDSTKSDKKYSLIFFGYSSCKTVCPTAMGDLTNAIIKNRKALDKIQPLFISLESSKDTPEVLKKFSINYDKSILMLTSLENDGEEYINSLSSRYNVYSAKINLSAEEQKQLNEDNNYTISHTSLFYLVDNKTGMVVKFAPDEPTKLNELLHEYGR
jgi:protein SCO1/2